VILIIEDHEILNQLTPKGISNSAVGRCQIIVLDKMTKLGDGIDVGERF
jgi:hypothetical protein